MPYLGPPPSQIAVAVDYQDLTGVTGSPAKRGFTLDNGVTNENEIEVFVNNVRQEPGVAYTVSGTALTMTGDVETTDDFYVVFQGKAVGTVGPPDGSVSSAKLASGAVTTAKLDTPIGIDTTSSTFKMTDLTNNAFYRAGTFTPEYSSTVATDPTAGILSGTYAFQIGEYVRIGDTVHVDIVVSSPSTLTYTNGGASAQSITIVGLPFNVRNLADYNVAATIGYYSNWNSLAAGYTPMGYAGLNSKSINLVYANGTSINTLATSNVLGSGSATTILHMTYQTDDA
jgi:hypothetical protein